MQAGLTDGRQILYGCVNTSTDPTFVRCQDSTVTNATFVFQPGERVTALNLWSGGKSASDVRGGFLSFNTSLVSLCYHVRRKICGRGPRARLTCVEAS